MAEGKVAVAGTGFRLACLRCLKSVTDEMFTRSEDGFPIIRAVILCPECYEEEFIKSQVPLSQGARKDN